LVSRRIARRLLLGGLFIVWLQPGVYPELPIYFANIETPLIFKLFRPENKNIWAAMAGFLIPSRKQLTVIALHYRLVGTGARQCHFMPSHTSHDLSRLEEILLKSRNPRYDDGKIIHCCHASFSYRAR
jgi:hypothetical protein